MLVEFQVYILFKKKSIAKCKIIQNHKIQAIKLFWSLNIKILKAVRHDVKGR